MRGLEIVESNPTRELTTSLAKRIAMQYSTLPQAEAVALGGSHATELFEPGSDIDLYVYSRVDIPLQARAAIAQASAARVELNNQFWESGDEWIDEETGIHVDVMFRHAQWIEEQLARVLVHHKASVGYSTCFWHNVLTSRLLFDRNGWFAALQAKASAPYPEALRSNIIAKNYPILRDTLSSYLYQIQRAVQRGDGVSISHRTAALLASYFDILFAVNRLPHSGEKRILPVLDAHSETLPNFMRTQVDALLAAASGAGDVVACVDALVDGLDTLLREQRLLEFTMTHR